MAKGAHRDFAKFPDEVQRVALAALTMAAEGGKADSAKPLKGVEGGVFEIALPFRGNAYRVVDAAAVSERMSGSWTRFRRSPRPGSRRRERMSSGSRSG